jgi:hypothetical protein
MGLNVRLPAPVEQGPTCREAMRIIAESLGAIGCWSIQRSCAVVNFVHKETQND